MKEFDFIIVGAGISGLYSALQIRKISPNASILILEKNEKLGGRMDIYNFYDNPVNTGAGVGRKAKDKILINLLDEFNIKYKEYVFHLKYSDRINKNIDMKKTIKLLKNNYTKKDFSTYTFKDYANHILGNDYKDFIIKTGFTDFEEEDAYDVLNYYGLDDNEDGWVGLSIDWALLIKKISKRIGLSNIKLNETVHNIESITNPTNSYIVNTFTKTYSTKKIIIATTIETVKKLLPNFKIYSQIHGQTFLRVYAKFSNPIPNLDVYTIVTGPLKKIIPINIKDCIYMIAYTDNKDAISLQKYTNNNLTNRKYFSKLVEKALDLKNELHIIGLKSFYWDIGTHYYEPIKGHYKNRIQFIHEAQHPEENMLVVGEMISKHQGWTLGALESVNVVSKEWIRQ
jgi:hypothetical protein